MSWLENYLLPILGVVILVRFAPDFLDTIKVMKMFVGLGNPGQEYQKTRHNAGFMVVDEIAKHLKSANFRLQKSLAAEVSKQDQTVLVKPQTFMNNSGQAVQAAWKFYNSSDSQDDFSQLYVIYDDLDLPLGQYKVQFGKGPKVHNGLNSVISHLKTDQFWHVRVGIDNRVLEHKIPGEKYVLTTFNSDETEVFETVATKLAAELVG